MSEPRTNESGYLSSDTNLKRSPGLPLLLPTPTASDSYGLRDWQKVQERGSQYGVGDLMATLFPVPT
ncbi:MAG TPA: hypothetical protein VHX38_30105 [Pseudonocardiaceae bacterium]|jgi:hypothetical protein|nr:hypothetical protein [Pseudonocardiaceae bacterium]